MKFLKYQAILKIPCIKPKSLMCLISFFKYKELCYQIEMAIQDIPNQSCILNLLKFILTQFRITLTNMEHTWTIYLL